MATYIHSTQAISPQHSFQADQLSEHAQEPTGPWFRCIHPDYKTLIPLAALRRMSPVIRMGLASALACLKEVELRQPDAILVGTGLGCIQDTIKFLRQMVDQEEQLLNPTAFIQSTHNTVAGQIALQLKCHAPNLTFSQKHLSFESAMLDALMLVEEDPGQKILLGGVDEITPESQYLMNLQGCIKDYPGKDLLHGRTNGAVPVRVLPFSCFPVRKREPWPGSTDLKCLPALWIGLPWKSQ